MNFGYDEFKATFQKLGFRFFEEGDYNLNIIGVRTPSAEPNKFDDYICVAYKVFGEPKIKVYAATTDPGLYWLENPMRLDGTAILVAPQQVRGGYELGLHQGKYEALRQVKPFQFVRDNNKDQHLDFYNPDSENDMQRLERDTIGANLHRASEWWIVEEVGKYSAACQVIQDSDDFDEFIELCNESAKRYGNSFTYTLLNQTDLVNEC